MRRYTEWTYDFILDRYLETKDKDFIEYLKYKKQNLDITQIMECNQCSFDEAFLYVLNIQNKLDGLMTIKNFESIKTGQRIDEYHNYDEEEFNNIVEYLDSNSIEDYNDIYDEDDDKYDGGDDYDDEDYDF